MRGRFSSPADFEAAEPAANGPRSTAAAVIVASHEVAVEPPASTDSPRPRDPDGGPTASTAERTGPGETVSTVDWDVSVSPSVLDRPTAPTGLLAGAILALFALLCILAGLPGAAARSLRAPAAAPARPVGGMGVGGPSQAPTPARWLCSSRAPRRAVPAPGGREWSRVAPGGRAC